MESLPFISFMFFCIGCSLFESNPCAQNVLPKGVSVRVAIVNCARHFRAFEGRLVGEDVLLGRSNTQTLYKVVSCRNIYCIFQTWSVWDMVVMWQSCGICSEMLRIKQGKHIIQMFKPKLRGKCRRVPCHSDVRPHHLIVLSAMPEIGNEIKSMIIQMPCWVLIIDGL